MFTYVTIVLFLASPLRISSLIHGNKLNCTEEGKIFKYSFLEQDPCITCQCKNRTIDCIKDDLCEARNNLQNAESAPNPVGLSRKHCLYKGKSYQNKETWSESCNHCTCTDGLVKCIAKVTCPQTGIIICPVGQELRKHSNDCCPRCVPTMFNTSPMTHRPYVNKQSSKRRMNVLIPKSTVYGVCTLDENGLVHTFDGRDYPLLGKCNYVFARDCSTSPHGDPRPPFSVNLVQKYQPHRNLLFRIRFQDKIIYLSHMGRVRINKQLVKLPYVKLGEFSIFKKNDEIFFKAILGFEIRFTINKTIEIKVKEIFKNKLCGLCGNYNGQASDDLQAKRSKNIVSSERFLYSYKVGQTEFCPRGQRFQSRIRSHKNANKRIPKRKLNKINQSLPHKMMESRKMIVETKLSRLEQRKRYPIGMI